MPNNKRGVVSNIVLVLALALVISSGFAIYFATNGTPKSTITSTITSLPSTTSASSTQTTTIASSSVQASNSISLESLSLSSSSSNLTATVNVKNSTLLTRMSLFINGTFVGEYNFTGNDWGYSMFSMINSWSNGSSSYFFTATPYWMPMMGNWNWEDYGYGMGMMGGYNYITYSYVITMMGTFANGVTSNATATILPNSDGTGWMCGSIESSPPTQATSTTQTTGSGATESFTIYVSYLGFNGSSGNLNLNVKQGDTVSIKFIWNDTTLSFDNAHQLEVQGYSVVSAVIDQQLPVSVIQFTASKAGSFQINCIIPCEGMGNLQNGLLIVTAA